MFFLSFFFSVFNIIWLLLAFNVECFSLKFLKTVNFSTFITYFFMFFSLFFKITLLYLNFSSHKHFPFFSYSFLCLVILSDLIRFFFLFSSFFHELNEPTSNNNKPYNNIYNIDKRLYRILGLIITNSSCFFFFSFLLLFLIN